MSTGTDSSCARVLSLVALLIAFGSLTHCDTPGTTPNCDAGDCLAADAPQPINTYRMDGGN